MSTPDVPGGPDVGELRLVSAQLPTAGDAPRAPAVGATTPGVSGAAVRHPGMPTLPDVDPMSLTAAITAMANQLFTAPPVAHPAAALPESPAPPFAEDTAYGAPASPFDLGPDAASRLGSSPGFAPGFSVPLLDGTALAGVPGAPDVPKAPAPSAMPVAPEAYAFAPAYEVSPTHDFALGGGAASFDPLAVKREFPILRERVNGRPVVWLDNAATTQKPQAVIDRLVRFYETENSNVHRAAHTLAGRATDAYEGARESVRRFLNAASRDEIVFVRGATEGINLVAKSWGARNVGAGDEILVTHLEHHANIVPWQQLASLTGARLRVAPVDDRGQVILEEYERLLGPRTKLVSFTQVSNALGTVTPAKTMVAMAHRHGARVLVDGAQAVSHERVDVQDLGADFYVFSGHKVFGPTGIGVVHGRREVLEATPPWQGGGNMIQDVTFERTVFHGPPARFEAGTGNIADAVGLGAALDWLARVGLERVEAYEHGLLEYGTELLCGIPGLRMIGTAAEKAGVLSFVVDGVKTEEASGLLDQEGIAVRSGHHCAQPILRRFGVEATIRASLAPYNTREDLEHLASALRRLVAGQPRR